MKKSRSLIVIAALALAAASCGGSAATPDANGEVVITMTEFEFSPNTIEVAPGQTVTFVLVNEGEKDHEFMLGRNVRIVDGEPSGFEVDFFESLEPTVVPMDAAMNMGDMADGDMADGDMADGDMADGDMADGDAAHAGHTGFMVVREPSQEARVTVTIPADASGEWEFGCFQENGAHWDDGMRGKLIIASDA